jgi:hypothetical protein
MIRTPARAELAAASPWAELRRRPAVRGEVRRAAAVLLLAAGALASLTEPAWAANHPPPLRDQLGREVSLASHLGEPVIALVVTAKRLRSLRGFEIELRKRAPGVSFLRVADVPAEPTVEYESVARKLRGRVPAEAAIGIDLQREWAATFELETSEVNALVFTADGELAARFRGRRSEALLDEVAAAARQAAAGAQARP